jgi:hypothetical protein
MSEKLELAADTVLVKLYGGVTGVTRRAEDKGTTHDGRAVETKNLVTTRQADAQEATKAKKLLSQLRATVDKYCTSVLNLTVASAGELPTMRKEIAPIQKQIDDHNRAARFHKIDRALIMAPIMLKADPAALTEVCRQICDELKTARAFFEVTEADPNKPNHLNVSVPTLADWLTPVNNWIARTKGPRGALPDCDRRSRRWHQGKELATGSPSPRANVEAGQSDESALRGALQTVTGVEGAMGLLDSAIGLTAITDSDAKAASDAARAEGASVGIH